MFTSFVWHQCQFCQKNKEIKLHGFEENISAKEKDSKQHSPNIAAKTD
jgi:hypothetical protein